MALLLQIKICLDRHRFRKLQQFWKIENVQKAEEKVNEEARFFVRVQLSQVQKIDQKEQKVQEKDEAAKSGTNTAKLFCHN